MSTIVAIILKYLIGLIGITIVVVIHELGHLVAAKLNNIEVEIFSVGLGPKIFGTIRKGTEYRLSLFPFGGYCRLKGSDDLSQALLHNQSNFTHTEEGSLFCAHPFRRILTYIVGPLSNILFAILIYAFLAAFPTQEIYLPPIIATTADYPSLFQNQGSPAYEDGLRKGDKILAIDAMEVQSWQDVEKLLSEDNETRVFTVDRNGTDLQIMVTGQALEQGGYRFGLTPIQDPIVGNIRYGSPEYQSNLKEGDVILAVQNQIITNQLDLITFLQQQPATITLTLKTAAGETKEVTYTPNFDETGKVDLGFSLLSQTKPAETTGFSLKTGLIKSWSIAKDTITSLISILSWKETDIRSSVTGMARSALMIGDITTLGFENNTASGIRGLLYLMGVVSISLAIVNLLPIPAFDGGQILLALFEWITKRQIKPKVYYYMQLFGIVFVFIVFVLLTITDIRHFLAIRR